MFNPEIKKFYGSSTLADAGTGASIGGMLGPEGALIGGVLGAGVGLVSGFFQKKKGKSILAQNPYPNQPIPAEELANQQAAQNMANEGMPSAQYQAANKNIQRQQAAAIAASQDRRLGGANVAAIQQNTNDATGNLDAQSAAIRRQNQLNLQNVNSGVAAYRDKAFDWNQKNKYLQNYQYGMSLLGQGNANMMAGADKLLGGLTQGAASGVFSGSGGSAGAGQSTPAPYNYTPALANTSSGGGSPAGLLGTISQVAPLLM